MDLQPHRKYLVRKGAMTVNPNNQISVQMDIQLCVSSLDPGTALPLDAIHDMDS